MTLRRLVGFFSSILCFVIADQHSPSRSLVLGDFDSINTAVLNHVPISIAPTTFTQNVLGSTSLTLYLSNIACSGLNLGDLETDWLTTRTENDILMTTFVRFIAIDLSCVMNYDYEFLFFRGGGNAYLQTQDNAVNTSVALNIETDDQGTRIQNVSATVGACQALVNIQDLTLDGDGLGLVASTLNALIQVMEGKVADEIQKALCEQVGQLDQMVTNGVQRVVELVEPYLGTNEIANSNSLEAESNLIRDPNVTVLNFSNLTTSNVGQVVDTLIMDKFTTFLSSKPATGDLQINALISDHLELDGGLTLDMAAMNSILQGGVLLDETFSLGRITVQATSIRMFGLNSFTVMEPFAAIGNYTLQTTMELERVVVKMALALRIEAAGTGGSYSENDILLELAFDQIGGSMAVLLALNEDMLGNLPLGIFANSGNLIDCLSSVLYAFQVSQLNITPLQLLHAPILSGVQSPGLSRIFTQATDEMFWALNSLFSTAIPRIVESMAVDWLSRTLLDSVRGAACPGMQTATLSSDTTIIDVRDLLLPASQALELGGSGSSPLGDLGVFARHFLESEFLVTNDQGLPVINDKWIAPFTAEQSGVNGSFVAKQPLVDYSGRIAVGGLDAYIIFRVDHARLEHLDSVGTPLVLLEPIRNETFLLINSAIMGAIPTKRVRVASCIFLSIETKENTIRNDVDLVIDLSSLSIQAVALMKLVQDRVMHFPVKDILDLNCWISTMRAPQLDRYGFRVDGGDISLAISELLLSIGSINVTMDCLECSSPRLDALSEWFASDEGRANIASLSQDLLGFVEALGTDESYFLQTFIDRWLSDAPIHCPHRPEYVSDAPATSYDSLSNVSSSSDDSSAKYLLALVVAIIAVAVIVVLVMIGVRFVVSRRQRKWLASLPNEQVQWIYLVQKQEEELEKAMIAASKSLFASKELPVLIRWAVPVVLLGTIALFLSGHLSRGGEVWVYIDLGGDKIVVDDFFTFSIAQSGIQLWEAGSKALAILLLLCSGVWPYVKQILTIALWFAPPRLVSLSRRGSALMWLDALAKWSIVDVFVMIITVAAFRVSVQSPMGIPSQLYQVEFLVVPLWGLYANMIAQLCSQISSPFIIYFHRKVVQSAHLRMLSNQERDVEKPLATMDTDESFDKSRPAPGERAHGTSKDDEVNPKLEKAQEGLGSSNELLQTFEVHGGKREGQGARANVEEPSEYIQNEVAAVDDVRTLRLHKFRRPHRGISETLRIRPIVNPSIVFGAVAVIVLVITGCVVPSVSYDYRGLVGLIMQLGMDFQRAQFQLSVIGIAQVLWNEARFLGTPKDYVGLASIIIVLVATTLIVPIIQTALIVAEWFLALKRSMASRIRVVVEILQAWQYVEVFVLSLIVGAWQLGDVSQFLINEYCGGLDQILADFVSYGIIRAEDAQCFQVQAFVEPAAYVLIAAAVVLLLLSSLVSKACYQRVRDDARLAQNEQQVQKRHSADVEPLGVINPVPVLFSDQFRWLLK